MLDKSVPSKKGLGEKSKKLTIALEAKKPMGTPIFKKTTCFKKPISVRQITLQQQWR